MPPYGGDRGGRHDDGHQVVAVGRSVSRVRHDEVTTIQMKNVILIGTMAVAAQSDHRQCAITTKAAAAGSHGGEDAAAVDDSG